MRESSAAWGTAFARRKAGTQRSGQVYWIAGTGGLAVVLGAVATAYWLRRRRREEGEVEEGDATAAQLIGTVLEESIDELQREPDARRVVIACYARMERALATVGLDRAPSEAPLEYLERVLLGFRATDEAVQRLTALFEEAKFSDHVVNERMREAAISSLSALRREVSTRPSMATA